MLLLFINVTTLSTSPTALPAHATVLTHSIHRCFCSVALCAMNSTKSTPDSDGGTTTGTAARMASDRGRRTWDRLSISLVPVTAVNCSCCSSFELNRRLEDHDQESHSAVIYL
jgi:hypothetical protein